MSMGKGGIAALIIGKLKGERGMSDSMDGGGGDWSKGKLRNDFGGDKGEMQEDNVIGEAAAQELIDAVKSGDASGVLAAFKGLKECC